jgi:hypothetical protein
MSEDLVIGVHVRKVDSPQLVAEDMEQLLGMVGEEWGGEQCDSCGCSAYTIERKANQLGRRDAPAGYVARCSGEDRLADEYEAQGDHDTAEAVRKGCGTTYSLRWYDGDKVAW